MTVGEFTGRIGRGHQVHEEPGVIGQDVSHGPPVVDQPGHGRGPLKHWEQRRADYESQVAESQQLVGLMVQHLGGIYQALTAPPTSDVLGQYSAQIAANGSVTRNWKQPFRSVTIANTSPSLIAVTTRPPEPSGQVPTLGVGTFIVPPGIERTIVCSGTALTVYGPIGTVFDVTLYTRPRPPSAGECGFIPQPLIASNAFAAATAGTVTMTPTNPNLTAWLRQITIHGLLFPGAQTASITGLAQGAQTVALPQNQGYGDIAIGPFPDGLPAAAVGGSIALVVASATSTNNWSAELSGFQR